MTPSRLVRHGLMAAMRPDDAARCHEAIAECLELGIAVSLEIEIAPLTKAAAPKWLELRCAPLPTRTALSS